MSAKLTVYTRALTLFERLTRDEALEVATELRQLMAERMRARECKHCLGEVPGSMQAHAQYCSRRCKERARDARKRAA